VKETKMSEKNKVEATPLFKKGDKVFSVITSEQLAIDKMIVSKTIGSFAYMVTPVKGGTPYRATEGELGWESPYAKKPKRTWEDSENFEE